MKGHHLLISNKDTTFRLSTSFQNKDNAIKFVELLCFVIHFVKKDSAATVYIKNTNKNKKRAGENRRKDIKPKKTSGRKNKKIRAGKNV